MNKTIGGEFQITLPNDSVPIYPEISGTLYSSGRAALYNIVLHTIEKFNCTTIYLPDYLCDSIIFTIAKLNITTRYYKVADNLTPEINSLPNKLTDKDIILVINYFGCIDTEKYIRQIKIVNPGSIVILDNVQAFFAMSSSTSADYTFTSFRKQLPVPDGALAISRHNDLKFVGGGNLFSFYKLAGAIVKASENTTHIPPNIYLELIDKGEALINEDLNNGMNELSKQILTQTDLAAISTARKRNAKFVISRLQALGIEPIISPQEGDIPLFIPIILKNRNTVRRKMFENSIFCPVHWPISSNISPLATKMDENELSLIIDHRYNPDDLSRMIDILKKEI